MRGSGAKGRVLAVGAFLVLGMACTSKTSFRTADPEVVKVDELPEDFKIPAHVWTLIEKSSDMEEPEVDVKNMQASYSNVKVFLTEKNEKVLRNPSYLIELPRGGGEVDLAQYLTGRQGSFYLGFELPAEFHEGSNFKVIYISDGRRRKLEDRIYGAGCNQYLDITPKFLEMMKGEGLKANTTRQRHATVLAGRYIFSAIKDHRVLMSQVTITDSDHNNLLCEAL